MKSKENLIFLGMMGSGKSDDNLNFTKNGKEAILNKLIQADGSIKNILENINGLSKNQKIIPPVFSGTS